MPVKSNFVNCITENLKGFGFGEKRTAEVIEKFEGQYEFNVRNGMTPQQAAMAAEDAVYNRMTLEAQEKIKRTQKTMEVIVQGQERLEQAAGIQAGFASLFGGANKDIGTRLGLAVDSIIAADPRFSGFNAESTIQSYRQKYMSLLSDSLEQYGKGVLGRNKASVESMNNVVRELYGENTGDNAARAFADSYRKVTDLMVDDFNAAGGSLSKRADYRIGQRQNSASVARVGKAEYAAKMNGWLDWDKMQWPDGGPILPAERADFLSFVYDTLVTDGANKIDPTVLRGRGAATGNMLDKQRLLIYKDADSWMQMHTEFGGGSNVLDVITGHIEQMAHKTGVVQTFGPNPAMTFESIKAAARKMAADSGSGNSVAKVDAIIKNKAEPMFETLTRQNAADPHSVMAASTATVSNFLAASQLGGAAIPAILGDLHQSFAMLYARGRTQGIFGLIGSYVDGMATNPAEFRKMSAATGFVFDNLVSNTYALQRYTGVATYGPAIGRTVSDTIMRASLMSKHTDVARAASRFEAMGFLARNANVKLEAHPMEGVMRRYGIDEADWNALRSLTPSEFQKGAKFLTPMDVWNSDLPNKDALYRKYFTMIDAESKVMVPGTTLEAQVFLKGTTRPDTFLGVIAQSFSAYKNFPVSMPMIYGRQLLAQENGRLGMAMALGLGMVGVGAVVSQIRALSQGKEPMPMDTAAFWGKAVLQGGALSIWGDLLTAGTTSFGQGPAETLAGPLAGFVGDVTKLGIGTPFKFMEALDQGEAFKGNVGSRAVEFAKRYTPGTNLWYARLAMERYLWDNLDKYVDPQEARKKARRKESKLRDDYGTEYWWRPGSSTF